MLLSQKQTLSVIFPQWHTGCQSQRQHGVGRVFRKPQERSILFTYIIMFCISEDQYVLLKSSEINVEPLIFFQPFFHCVSPCMRCYNGDCRFQRIHLRRLVNNAVILEYHNRNAYHLAALWQHLMKITKMLKPSRE